MNHPRKKFMIVTFAATAFAYLATDALMKAAHLHINFSNSVPVGLYRETVTEAGDYAGICLPKETVAQAVHAGLGIDPGTCPGGFEPILKPVFLASPTSPIRFDHDGFSVHGRLLPNTAPKSRSKTGVLLSHTPFGLYQTGVWAISGFNASSFDSRYFGSVNPGSIQFHAKPFLTF